jgi:hypothetical protein
MTPDSLDSFITQGNHGGSSPDLDGGNTIREIHDAFDRKTFSAQELTSAFFARIRGSQHNAYLTLCEDRALAQAKSAAILC